MADELKVLGFAGSLRKRSFNRALLAAAVEVAPASLTIEIYDLSPIPLYNGDLDNDERRPAAVDELKKKIASADALLIASPEYNFAVPGVLKNAIDWASRPGFKSVLVGKPVGLMGASGGVVGTARGQEQLKALMLAVLAHPFPHPGVLVGQAQTKFNESLELSDERTRDFLSKYLDGFATFARKLHQG